MSINNALEQLSQQVQEEVATLGLEFEQFVPSYEADYELAQRRVIECEVRREIYRSVIVPWLQQRSQAAKQYRLKDTDKPFAEAIKGTTIPVRNTLARSAGNFQLEAYGYRFKIKLEDHGTVPMSEDGPMLALVIKSAKKL